MPGGAVGQDEIPIPEARPSSAQEQAQTAQAFGRVNGNRLGTRETLALAWMMLVLLLGLGAAAEPVAQSLDKSNSTAIAASVPAAAASTTSVPASTDSAASSVPKSNKKNPNQKRDTRNKKRQQNAAKANKSTQPNTLQTLGENFQKLVETAPERQQQRQAERKAEDEFIKNGMRPRPSKPIRKVDDPASVLGPLPRFTDHPYYTEAFQDSLDLNTNSRLTAGNRMKILPDSLSWQTKKQLMAQAQHTLYVTTMLLICDEGGREFVNGMVAAAKRGVDVRFVVDGLFSFYTGNCLSLMRNGGVKVAISLRSIRPDKLDWESHEKLFVVDGEVAITGGTNVGSWYQNSDGFDENYRDTDIWLSGPVVIDIARRFVGLWTALRPDDRSLDSYVDELDMRDYAFAAEKLVGKDYYQRWLKPNRREGLCRFVAQDPHLNTFHVWTAYEDMIEQAKKRVMFTAYALAGTGTPNQDRMRSVLLNLARRDGAMVDAITNGYGNLSNQVMPPVFRTPYSISVLRSAWKSFGETPVRLWVYHYFTHAKQYYFDGVAVAIGSFNYDDSGNRCQESTVICIDPGLVKQAESLFARDIANSWRLSGEALDAMENPPNTAHRP